MPRVVPSLIVSFMAKTYPWLPNHGNPPIEPRSPGSIRGLLTLLDRVPDEVIQLAPADFITLIASTERLRAGLDVELRWRSFTSEEIQSLREVYHLVSKCPDDVASPDTTGLPFIDEPELREALLLDLSEVNKSLHNREWKGATVLAGSITEALLLWALQNRMTDGDILAAATKSGRTLNLEKRPLLEWGLGELIASAFETNLISKSTKAAAELGKDFRNFIHPGNAMRSAMRCNRATALFGTGAVEAVIADLTQNQKGN